MASYLSSEISQEINGPAILQSKHGPRDGDKKAVHGRSTGNPFLRLQPLPYELFKFHPPPQTQTRHPPPIHKPPPHLPDFPLNSPWSEINFTISVVHVTSCPSSICISGKVDAAGKDPGDIRFLQSPASVPLRFDFDFDFKHRLVGKACFKEFARVVLRTSKISHVKEWSFDLPPPTEPPPCPSTVLVSVLSVLINTLECISLKLSRRKDAAGDDPGVKGMKAQRSTLGEVLAKAIAGLNRVDEASYYEAYGHIFQTNTNLGLILCGKFTELILGGVESTAKGKLIADSISSQHYLRGLTFGTQTRKGRIRLKLMDCKG